MHSSISIMEEDHSNINRALAVVRALCLQLMNGAEVPDEDFRTLIDFIRNYADRHHHGKEEKFLFPVMVEKMGPVADKLVTHGMLVEHDLGYSFFGNRLKRIPKEPPSRAETGHPFLCDGVCPPSATPHRKGKQRGLPLCRKKPQCGGLSGYRRKERSLRERAGRKGCSGTLPRCTGAPGKKIPFLVLFPEVYPFFTVFFLAIWYTETRYRVFL